jgi:hypothetical protein
MKGSSLMRNVLAVMAADAFLLTFATALAFGLPKRGWKANENAAVGTC